MASSIIVLKDLSEWEFASTNPQHWPMMDWVAETCAEEFECSEDDVSLIENDDGEEIILIDGEPKARLIYRWPRQKDLSR